MRLQPGTVCLYRRSPGSRWRVGSWIPEGAIIRVQSPYYIERIPAAGYAFARPYGLIALSAGKSVMITHDHPWPESKQPLWEIPICYLYRIPGLNL